MQMLRDWQQAARTLVTVLFAATVLAACGAQNTNDTAQMVLNKDGGPLLSENQSIALAGWALRDPAITHGKPELAARAIAAEDWLAGQWQLYGGFGNWAPLYDIYWIPFRQEVRASIGVAPGSPSQAVINALFATAAALEAKEPDPGKSLQPPVFTLGPEGTLQALSNLPPYPALATAFAVLRANQGRTFGQPCWMRVC
jgi:hypothetical protein